MRKIFFILIMTVASQLGFAQFNTVQFSPATFTGDDQVTMTIDLTGTSLAGEAEVYIWAFANGSITPADPQYPSKDGITNTSWGNSPDIAKFTNLGGNLWSFTFTGSELFQLTPGQLKHFQFLVKTKTGNKQTSDSPKYPFAPVAYVPAVYRLFPSRMNQDDAITIYFYQNLSREVVESRMTPLTATVKLYNGATQVGPTISLPLTDKGGKLFSARPFIPVVEGNVPAGTTLTSFTYSIDGTYFDTLGNPVNVTGTVNTRVFDILN